MSTELQFRVGLCGIGLDAYWSQFAGLKERLESHLARLAERLKRPGVEVVNLDLIDTPQRSQQAGRQCRIDDVDVPFLYVTTYALSSTVLPLVQRAGVPVVVLNLQPEAAIDYRRPHSIARDGGIPMYPASSRSLARLRNSATTCGTIAVRPSPRTTGPADLGKLCAGA